MTAYRTRIVKVQKSSPDNIRMTLEKHGWFWHVQVNDSMSYKKNESVLLKEDNPKVVPLFLPSSSAEANKSLPSRYKPETQQAVQSLMEKALKGDFEEDPPRTRSTVPAVIKATQELVPIEKRLQNLISFFPNPHNFPGPVRQRLHNMMQGLDSADDRAYVEWYMEEHFPISKGIKS